MTITLVSPSLELVNLKSDLCIQWEVADEAIQYTHSALGTGHDMCLRPSSRVFA